MKIDTLNFLTVLLNSHTPSVLLPHLGNIVPAVVKAVDDSFYRITSEALLVLNCIVKTTRPADREGRKMKEGGRTLWVWLYRVHHDHTYFTSFVALPIVPEFESFVGAIYQAALRRLKAADIDQEVKERAITCMGQVVASLGDHLQNELSECMPIFVDRLRNEITRLTTVRAITLIVR